MAEALWEVVVVDRFPNLKSGGAFSFSLVLGFSHRPYKEALMTSQHPERGGGGGGGVYHHGNESAKRE